MMAEAADLKVQLLPDSFDEFLVGGVEAAGEHHILPDQQPFAVAEAVELFGFILAASPDAEHVHIGEPGGFEQIIEHCRRHPGGHRVGGNPVGTLAENVESVDAEIHGNSVFIGLVDDLNRPQPDLLFDTFVVGRDGERVEHGFSETVGPPELRIFNDEERLDPVFSFFQRCGDGFRFAVEGEGDRFPPGAQSGEFRDGGDGDTVFLMLLDGVDEIDPGEVDAGEGERRIDAGNHQRDAPVPAAVAVDFADQIEVGHLGAAVHRDFPLLAERLFFCLEFRRFEVNPDDVASGLERGLDLRAVAAEHVVAGEHPVAVDEDGPEGVELFDIEVDAVVFEQGGRNLELTFELPLILAEFLNDGFVAAEIGIGNRSRFQQGGVVVAGQCRRNGTAVFPFGAFQRPFAA